MRKRVWAAAVAAVVLPALTVAVAVPAWAKVERARPFVGILAEPPAEQADKPGVVVHDVAPDSPAAKAGLKKGDRIVKAGDKEVKTFDALADLVKAGKPGDKLALHVVRDGKDHTLTVTLGEHQARKPHDEAREAVTDHGGVYLGVHTQELTAELKDRLGLTAEKGALVTDVLPGTPAAKAGLKEEDVITGVNDVAVAGPKELRDAVQKSEAGKDVTVKVTRGKEKMELKAKLEEMPAGRQAAWQDFRRMMPPQWAERFGHEMPFSVESSDNRVPELEKRVQELEKTVRELQKKLDKAGK